MIVETDSLVNEVNKLKDLSNAHTTLLEIKIDINSMRVYVSLIRTCIFVFPTGLHCDVKT